MARKSKGAARGDTIYQIRVSLQYLRPEIWRLLLVPDCDLGQLHAYIQAAFGWEDFHLHHFLIDRKYYGSGDSEDGILDETEYRISELLLKSVGKSRWLYEYDLGDSWLHAIEIQKGTPRDPSVRYPMCLAGERAGPPEDCGGPPGYEALIEAVKSRDYAQLQEFGLTGKYDPEAFDAKKVTHALWDIDAESA